MVQRKEFDAALKDLRDWLSQMGSHVEWALSQSIEALKALDVELAKAVISRDPELNQLEEKIIEIGSRLIVTQQPVAKDIRTILVAFKIASDLERMGDLSVDVAKVVVRMEGQELIKPLVDLPRMAGMVTEMIRDSMAAFYDGDVDLAYKMAKVDDDVDQLYSQLLRELFTFMVENPQTISQGVLLSFVGRYIERIADHATNIGESVVYLMTGKRIDLNQ